MFFWEGGGCLGFEVVWFFRGVQGFGVLEVFWSCSSFWSCSWFQGCSGVFRVALGCFGF